MIISVSRRTDIPKFYWDWFLNRIQEGYVLTQNPFNKNLVHSVSLKTDDVKCFVFWTKDPSNIILSHQQLQDYHYYVQYTLTAYQHDIEPNLPSKNELINKFKDLSKLIGKSRVVWRYDPILISNKYTKQYHYHYFEVFCQKLNGYTNKCVISFIYFYKRTTSNKTQFGLQELNDHETKEIVSELSRIADKYHIQLEGCCEEISINKSKCIDDKLISGITNQEIIIPKDKYQRKECGCVSSVDIGSYNTCWHNCIYCYANYSDSLILKNKTNHYSDSPLLIGRINNQMKIYEKR